jgi:hypothetical protein
VSFDARQFPISKKSLEVLDTRWRFDIEGYFAAEGKKPEAK